MAATTTLLSLVTPTQGTLSGTWGDTVNYGISDYLDIAIAGTLSFAGDGAITLANTVGSASGNAITSTTAQYMIIRVTGTLTTPKIITGPSYSKLYMVDNAATGSTVTFKAAGQSGVSVAVGEECFVYYNGTDYVKVASSFITALSGTLGPANGGTGIANNAASTLAISGNFPTTLTVTGTTGITLPTTGTLATLAGSETLTNKTLTAPILTAPVLGIPASGTLTNATGLPAAGVVGTAAILGANTFTAAQEWASGTAIASASTINLDTATGNRVHITGTTAITTVTLTRGPRTVIFDGILTLTHNATTNNLPGAANITTAAGDRAIYESDGTTVYCVSYIKVNGEPVVAAASFSNGKAYFFAGF